MNTENVVALPGFGIPSKIGEPIPAIVEMLEEYLQDAKDGRVVGIAIALVRKDNKANETLSHDFAADTGMSWALSVSLGRLVRRFNNYMDD